ncbi:MAG TPA: PIN domain-containing protein [Thermoanaerobaculia bacterium]
MSARPRGLVAADATVVVAALVTWHERHRAAGAAIEQALARKALVLPAPALVESYAILTRLPAQHRLAHADAFHLLRSSFAAAKLSGLRASETWSLLRKWSVAPVGGGETWDAMLIDAAIEAGAKTLLSFRRSELERIAASAIEVVEPV